eukprot:Nitzschia sp. Nitz4//scaffold14_size191712//143497//143955//NITZ4_001745-RA/size191712-exonerate_est2genome-gene-0.165-mRNA-1//-1//CDS//3329536993//7624//frame0
MSSNSQSFSSCTDSSTRYAAPSSTEYEVGRNCTLFCHPLGLLLLEFYCKLQLATGTNASSHVLDPGFSDELKIVEQLQGTVADFLENQLHGQEWKEDSLVGSAGDKEKNTKPSGLFGCIASLQKTAKDQSVHVRLRPQEPARESSHVGIEFGN